MTAGDPARRLVKRFTWDVVDADLIRYQLDIAYAAAGDAPSRTALADRHPDALPALADRAFGTPPASRHMDVLVDPLRDMWLAVADDEVLAELVAMIQLGVTGPARTQEFRTRAERIEFVRGRRRTDNLLVNLRRAFIRAHRQQRPVRPGPERATATAALQTASGADLPDPREPYTHQLAAWAGLDELARGRTRAARSGRLVLPTGAGKTYTLVRWLVERMAGDDRLQVLWIADRQELVDQAASTFLAVAQAQPVGFERTLRRIHNAACPVTTLADGDLDIAVVTRQSLRGQFDGAAKRRIRRFVGDRPTVAVVDEAHHAIARTYEDLLDFLGELGEPLLVGLTATPWPSGNGATKRLLDRFPVLVAKAEPGELVRLGVLARPVHHSVDTGERVELTDVERTAVVGDADLPSSVLRKFDSERRNDLVVEAWWAGRGEWGKSLVFAVDIDHAERLHELFRERGAEALAVHSRSETSRAAVLERFRALDGPAVLVSVGMLTEGVDLPDARTAVLARPTTSRILMRQMIGRVLRGPRAGGDAIAHIVDVRDRWGDDVDVLRSDDIPGVDGVGTAGGAVEHGYRLPPILDELTVAPVPQDVLSRVLRGYRERVRDRSALPLVTSVALVGFYRLDDVSPPVFDHTRDAYRELIAAELLGRGVRNPVENFGDLPIPRPARRDVDAVVAFVRETGTQPPFEPLLVPFDMPAIVAEFSGLAMTPAEQERWLRERFEATLARSVFPDFGAFYEAVHQALTKRGGIDPESRGRAVAAPTAQRLCQVTERDLDALLQTVRERATGLLADEQHYVELLRTPIEIGWTTRRLERSYAYWAPRISGRQRGRPMIRVNVVVRAPAAQIPDAVLEYLIWHEVVHHLTPGQGHDAEFRRLEALWPDSAQHDHFIDTLHERFDLTDR